MVEWFKPASDDPACLHKGADEKAVGRNAFGRFVMIQVDRGLRPAASGYALQYHRSGGVHRFERCGCAQWLGDDCLL